MQNQTKSSETQPRPPITKDPEIFKLFERKETPKGETGLTFIMPKSKNLDFLEEWQPSYESAQLK